MKTRPAVVHPRHADLDQLDALLSLHNPQAVKYDDEELARSVVQTLAARPPLVASRDVDRLTAALDSVRAGKAIALQLGDCAERFGDASPASVRARVQLFLRAGRLLSKLMACPAVVIGRFAGQFGKPRSALHESAPGEVGLPTYRGDIINDPAADITARTPDPARMLRAYDAAATSIALADGVLPSSGLASGSRGLARVGAALFTSHELLLLPFEWGMTRRVLPAGTRYDLSAHFLWIGDRTRSPDGAHVALARDIANPIGVKLGPATTTDELLRLLRVLNPKNRPGRITLITRLGASRVDQELPCLIEAVHRAAATVLWGCDPLHGNTETTSRGRKTRRFAQVLHELEQTIVLHARHGSSLSLLHLEATPERVTECLGGPGPAQDASDLLQCYRSACDPRLNDLQLLGLIEQVSASLGPLWQASRAELRARRPP